MDKQEKMYALVEEYRHSGQSVQRFCNGKRMKPTTFRYWIRKKKKEEVQSSSFIPISTQVASTPSEGVELVYTNGVRVRLKSFHLNQIRELIKLQEC